MSGNSDRDPQDNNKKQENKDQRVPDSDNPSTPGSEGTNMAGNNVPPPVVNDQSSDHDSNAQSDEAVHGGSSGGGSRPQSSLGSVGEIDHVAAQASNLEYLTVDDNNPPPSPPELRSGSLPPIAEIDSLPCVNVLADSTDTTQSISGPLFCRSCNSNLGTTLSPTTTAPQSLVNPPLCLECINTQNRSGAGIAPTPPPVMDFSSQQFTNYRDTHQRSATGGLANLNEMSDDEEMPDAPPIRSDAAQENSERVGTSNRSVVRPSNFPEGFGKNLTHYSSSNASCSSSGTPWTPGSAFAATSPNIDTLVAGRHSSAGRMETSSGFSHSLNLPDDVRYAAAGQSTARLDLSATEADIVDRESSAANPSEQQRWPGSDGAVPTASGSSDRSASAPPPPAADTNQGASGYSPVSGNTLSPSDLLRDLGPPESLSPEARINRDNIFSPRVTPRVTPYNRNQTGRNRRRNSSKDDSKKKSRSPKS